MKVLHINTGQNGGAAWCAQRINNALVLQGVESKMLFAEGDTMHEGVDGAIAERDKIVKWRRNWLVAKFRHLLMRLPWYWNTEKMQATLDKANVEHLYLHQPFSDFSNIAHHPLVEWADIIHLHWVPNFVDYRTFFKEVKKPIVWTLHDKYPAVGCQHYCSQFSLVPDYLKAFDQQCIVIKRKGVLKSNNLHVVAISEFMMALCEKSEVLKGFPCMLIHNGVDTNKYIALDNTFYPFTDLTQNSTLFLFVAYDIFDQNKGLDRVVGALELLDCPNKALVIVGNLRNGELPKASFPISFVGRIYSQDEMTKIYSSVNYFILASYEETFSQTPLEAMSCGTPVISTPCSGATDLIRPFNGIVCNGFSSEDICTGINEALKTNYDRTMIRQYVVDKFDYKIIAKQYIDLYSKVLNS